MTTETPVLRNRNFRQLFLADTLSQTGMEVGAVAMPLVAVTALHASSFQVGLLTGFETVAYLVIGLPAGAWVDRWRRRRVLMASNLGRAVLLAVIPFCWWAHLLSIYQLLGLAIATGVCTVFFDAAYGSYLPALVDKDQLMEGNARLQTVQSVAQLAGPGLGGLLIQAVGAPATLVVTVAGYLWSLGFLSRIRIDEIVPERKPDRHLGREIREGLQVLLTHPLLRRIAICTASFNFFWSMGTPMFLLFLARTLHFPAGAIGLVIACGGLGGIAGAFFVDRAVNALGSGPTMWISAAVSGSAGLLLPAAAHDWRIVLAAAGQCIASVAMVIYNVSVVSFRQAITPEAMLGRVSAGGRVLVLGMMPLGGMAAGLLGGVIGFRTTLLLAAASATVSFLWIFFSPLRTMRELPAT